MNSDSGLDLIINSVSQLDQSQTDTWKLLYTLHEHFDHFFNYLENYFFRTRFWVKT